jgi:hypothetical protein
MFNDIFNDSKTDAEDKLFSPPLRSARVWTDDAGMTDLTSVKYQTLALLDHCQLLRQSSYRLSPNVGIFPFIERWSDGPA